VIPRSQYEDLVRAALREDAPNGDPFGEALRGVGRELMRNHLKHCAAAAIKSGDAEAEAMYDELVDLMYKHNR
jgi:hypothetical protein